MVDPDSTKNEKTVILKNIASNEAIRMPVKDLTAFVSKVTGGQTTWADAVNANGLFAGSELTAKVSISYNAEANEFTRSVKYREGADNEAPNEIYKKIFEDNTKFTFENDIYSQEFFEFILQILSSISQLGGGDQFNDVRNLGLQVGKKAAFEILLRCFNNNGIGHVS